MTGGLSISMQNSNNNSINLSGNLNDNGDSLNDNSLTNNIGDYITFVKKFNSKVLNLATQLNLINKVNNNLKNLSLEPNQGFENATGWLIFLNEGESIPEFRYFLLLQLLESDLLESEAEFKNLLFPLLVQFLPSFSQKNLIKFFKRYFPSKVDKIVQEIQVIFDLPNDLKPPGLEGVELNLEQVGLDKSELQEVFKLADLYLFRNLIRRFHNRIVKNLQMIENLHNCLNNLSISVFNVLINDMSLLARVSTIYSLLTGNSEEFMSALTCIYNLFGINNNFNPLEFNPAFYFDFLGTTFFINFSLNSVALTLNSFGVTGDHLIHSIKKVTQLNRDVFNGTKNKKSDDDELTEDKETKSNEFTNLFSKSFGFIITTINNQDTNILNNLTDSQTTSLSNFVEQSVSTFLYISKVAELIPEEPDPSGTPPPSPSLPQLLPPDDPDFPIFAGGFFQIFKAFEGNFDKFFKILVETFGVDEFEELSTLNPNNPKGFLGTRLHAFNFIRRHVGVFLLVFSLESLSADDFITFLRNPTLLNLLIENKIIQDLEQTEFGPFVSSEFKRVILLKSEADLAQFYTYAISNF